MASIVPAKPHLAVDQAGCSTVERWPALCHITPMSLKPDDPAEPQPQPSLEEPSVPSGNQPKRPREIGGPKGPEPTRYGDWEVGGRCTDF
jgi:hypothetical protein